MTGAAPSVLELRVHGVSGTPPPAVLGVRADQVRQVAGDDTTGFWRTVPGVTPSGGRVATAPVDVSVEAYSWGGLTSSARGTLGWLQRALWLTLLPFALVNVAMWSRPGLWSRVDATGLHRATPAATAAGAVVRVAAVLLTALLTATLCEVGVDLLAWQCFRDGVASCPVLPGWTDVLASDALDDTGRRLAVGQLVPLAALAGLLVLARTTIGRYESARDAAPPTTACPSSHAYAWPLLAHPDMWRGDDAARALTNLHVAVGTGVVVLATAWPVSRLEGPDRARPLVLAAAVLAALLVVAGLVVAGLLSADAPGARPGPVPVETLRSAGWWLLRAAVVLLVASTALLVWGRTGRLDESGDLPGLGALPVVLVLALFVAVALLVAVPGRWSTAALVLLAGLAVLSPAWVADPGARFAVALALVLGLVALGVLVVRGRCAQAQALAWSGLAPAVLLGTATMVAVLFSTGATLLAADRLNGGPPVGALGVTAEGDGGAGGRHRLAGGATLRQGWLDLTGEGPVLRRGLVETTTLERVDDGVRTGVSSLVLPPTGLLEVPDDQLVLVDGCLTRGGGTARAEGPVVVPLPTGTAVRVDAAAPLPASCGDLLSAPLRVRTTGTPAPLVVPAPWVWFATVLPAGLLASAVSLGLLRRRVVRRAGAELDALADLEYLGSEELQRRARRARRSAAVVHRAEPLLVALAVPAVLVAAVVAAGTLAGVPPPELVGSEQVAAGLAAAADLGLLVALALALAVVGLGARLRTDSDLRRSVGVLWDLCTYLPRAAHPFAPPCYAERAVPEIVTRAHWALRRGDALVLSGHSQGSTLCASALLQLTPGQLARVRFVSYGSQLRAWFGRVFPDLLGPDVLGHRPTTRPRLDTAAPDAGGGPEDLHPGCGTCAGGEQCPRGTLAHRLGVGEPGPRWQSLYRRSDPLGFRVHQDADPAGGTCGAVDVLVLELPAPDAGDPAPPVATHSGYPATEAYRRVVERWWDEIAREARQRPVLPTQASRGTWPGQVWLWTPDGVVQHHALRPRPPG